jgi:iron complex transport system substrate-binding protein
MSSLGRDRDVLQAACGADVVDRMPVTTEDQPSLENVIAQRTDVMVS